MKKLLYIMLALLMALSASCTKYNRELEYATQEEKIGGFVQRTMSADSTITAVYEAGTVRLVRESGEGVGVSARGSVTFYYAGYDFSSYSISNSSLFATNNRDFAASAGWKITDESIFEPLTVNLAQADILPGLRYGLRGVKKGEVCQILFTGKLGFGPVQTGTIPADAPLAFQVWVLDIEN